MSSKLFHLTIITPERVVFDNDIEQVQLPTTQGELTILADHANLLSTLAIGPITASAENDHQDFAVSGGFLDVHDNSVTILAHTAEHGEEIDEQRAQEARERAEKLLTEVHSADRDQALVSASLQKALLRLKVAERHRKRRRG